MRKDFRKELETLINSHSIENGSNTPDFMLAEYLINCLAAFDQAVRARDKWYSVQLCPGNSHFMNADSDYMKDDAPPSSPAAADIVPVVYLTKTDL